MIYCLSLPSTYMSFILIYGDSHVNVPITASKLALSFNSCLCKKSVHALALVTYSLCFVCVSFAYSSIYILINSYYTRSRNQNRWYCYFHHETEPDDDDETENFYTPRFVPISNTATAED
ncbi:unnamed protein product, partial [Amoebophrya sp. A25]|eukprot:GSA25T00007602001.1